MLGGGDPGQQTQAPQQGGLFSNPLAKAALAGIAAMAIKRVLGARSATAGTGTDTQPGARPIPGGSIGDIPSPPSSREATPSSGRTVTAATAAGQTTQTTQTAQAERWHQVVSGDSLSKLAAKYYGDGRQWMRIFEANRDSVTDPDRIRIGQRLRIP
jgi:nucleoid-associated protein YgaU